jgi:hypothetical protein
MGKFQELKSRSSPTCIVLGFIFGEERGLSVVYNLHGKISGVEGAQPLRSSPGEERGWDNHNY